MGALGGHVRVREGRPRTLQHSEDGEKESSEEAEGVWPTRYMEKPVQVPTARWEGS